MISAIVWFRNDLRLEDNKAWCAAIDEGASVVPLFVVEDGMEKLGTSSRWWLGGALRDLDDQLKVVGSRLLIRRSEALPTILKLASECDATHVYWNRRYEPGGIRTDSMIKEELAKAGVEARSFNSQLLREPWEVSTQAGSAYKVYTPFSRAFAELSIPAPVQCSGKPIAPDSWPEGIVPKDLELVEQEKVCSGITDTWKPDRASGLAELREFVSKRVGDYADARDIPGEKGTSRISPYLRWGQIGPREVVAALQGAPESKGRTVYHKELLWREFAYHVLYHFPDTVESPLQRGYDTFPWRSDAVQLERWKSGLTGFPIVDAGMRELAQTGWMHNRVRMITGSFLVKHLLHSWKEGASWFYEKLVDADLASNTFGWQWVGGCGADAAPYFRIFNPILQGKRFDPDGKYIRRFIPELKHVPNKKLHTPWQLTPSEQRDCQCQIGETYPEPVIEHEEGRKRALEAWAAFRGDQA
jgi:deoxyribodipyrimidine photo-lyase